MTEQNDNFNLDSEATDSSVEVALNAWVVRLGQEIKTGDYCVDVVNGHTSCRGLQEGDGVLIVDEKSKSGLVTAFARIYRKRSVGQKATLFFDGFVKVDRALSELGLPPLSSTSSIIRLDWPTFETALKTASSFDFKSFPVMTGDTPREQAYIRELLQCSVEDDLLGPANGPDEEIIGMSVRDRYLVGKLAPRITGDGEAIEGFQGPTATEDDTAQGKAPGDLNRLEGHHHVPGEEFSSTEGRTDPDDDDIRDADVASNQSLVPSSMGFTFCIDGTVRSIELQARWGRYDRRESARINEKAGNPFRCWKRIPSGGSTNLSLDRRNISPIVVDEACPSVFFRGTVSKPLENGDRLVTIFLVNGQTMPEHNQDQAWVFQPELIVRDIEGRAIFRRRPIMKDEGFDDEREALEMIYRQRVEFAVGHGVSVRVTTADAESERAVEIRTKVLPAHEIPVTETTGSEPDDRPAMRRMVKEGLLDMERLAEMDRDMLTSTLTVITEDYATWISEQRSRIGMSVRGYDNMAAAAMDRCELVLERLREGISMLGSNDMALQAFRFANRAMASQRVHSVYTLSKRREENPDLGALNVPKNRSWRPFQLAFILLAIPALADPTHHDRTAPLEAYADLLWFPTGGGKTEAYLGVAAFSMAIRRRQGNLGGLDAGRGLSVIMRYTLRLLTIQQFQRATTLICAMEVLRREDTPIWGMEPFTIGLWVGQRVTPNKTEDAHTAIQSFRDGQRQSTSSPAQLTTCPWCGAEISEGRDIEVKRFGDSIGRTIIYCGDSLQQCDFSRAKSNGFGLPVLVVDDEIYRRPPSMLIATVDKFAMMAWKGQIRTLFGRADRECPRHGLLWPEAECNGVHRKRGNLPATSLRTVMPIRPPDLIIQDEFHLISGPLGTMVGLYETTVDSLSTWYLDGKAIKPKVIASTATVRKAEKQVNDVFLRRVAVFPPPGLDVEDNFFSVQRPIDEKPGRKYMGICSPGSSRPAVLIRVYVALLTASQSLFERFGLAADPYMTLVGYFNSLRELGGMRRLAEDDVQTRSFRVLMGDVVRPGLSQRSVRNVDELTSRVSSKDIPKKLDQLEVKFKSSWAKGETRAIDIVLATNMLSVGVDVNRIGLMVVNGQPKNTAEYIQATSRIGRFFPGLVCTVLTWSRPRDLSHYETFEHYHATFYKHVEAQSVTPFAPRALDRGLTGIMVSLMRLDSEPMNPNIGAQQLDSTTKPEAEKVKLIVSERAGKVKDMMASQNASAMVASRIDRWVSEATRAGRRLGYERDKDDVAALLRKPGGSAWDEVTVPMSMREVEPGVRLMMDVARLTEPPGWQQRVRDEANEGGES